MYHPGKINDDIFSTQYMFFWQHWRWDPWSDSCIVFGNFQKDIFFFSLFSPILDPVCFADNGTKYSIESYTQQVTNQII